LEEEQNKTKIKVIYWVVALIPVVLLNLSPYLGISFPETIDNNETFHDLVFGFSLVFILFLLGIFGSYKCWVNSEMMATKIISSLFLLLYLLIVFAMSYIFFKAYIGT